MSNNKIVRGTFLLTGAAFISKFLGMIYIIPFNELVGAKGAALYYYAYNPYTILISISTVGIPLAVSKMVSKYNSLEDYDTGLRIFRASFILMAITGTLAFLTLFFSAEWLASKFVHDDQYSNKVEDVKQVIQMVSFALILIPSMSVVRGYFQGNQKMEPTAISQVVEQIVRIAFVLISVFIVIKVYKGSIPLAVSFATFAAFVGALASCGVLLLAWIKRNQLLPDVTIGEQKLTNEYKSTKELFVELLSYAGPFILVGIATPLYQFVDTFTFNRAMIVSGYGEISELSLTAITFLGHKLIIIPVTLATGLSLTIVPALTESFTQQNRPKLIKEMNQALQLVLFFVIPAVFGLMALSYEAYGSLYGMENLDITGDLLRWYSPVALLFALFTVSSAILQGINEQRFAVLSLLAGFLIKVLFNSMLIQMFAGKGSIIATGLAVGAASFINLWRIKRAINFSFVQTFKRILFMVIFSIVMFVVIYIVKVIFGLFLPYEESRFAAVIMLSVGVAVGGAVYLWLTYKSTLMEYVLGSTNILNRFRRKKS